MNFGISLTRASLLVFTGACLLFTSVMADVVSTSGNIDFKLQDSGANVMRLTSTGFGIGSDLSPSANLHVEGNVMVTNSLSIGGPESGSSNLTLSGTSSFAPQTFNTSGNIQASTVCLANSASGNLTLRLPAITSGEDGLIYHIKKISSENEVVIRGRNLAQLDQYPSLKLSSGNLGTLKVIAHSGNWHVLTLSGNIYNPFTPEDVEPTCWFDASDALTVTGSPVSLWADKSENGNDASQGSSSARPSTGTTINGLNVLTFDDASPQDQMRLDTYITGSGPIYAFIIARAHEANSTNYILYDIGNSETTRIGLSSSNILAGRWDSSGSGFSGPAVPDSGTDLVMFEYWVDSSNNGYTSSNGDNPTSFGMLTVDTMEIARIGRNGSSTFDGDIGEIIITQMSISTSYRQKIEGYLAHKWGVEGQLPGGHTYKTSPP